MNRIPIVRDGYVFIFGALALAGLLALAFGPLGAVVPVILAC